jgi:hypothetical protein
MRFSRYSLAIFCFIGAASIAADPAKDPGGWAEVKFGMTPDEVLKALGPDGYVKAPPPEETRRPFSIDETVDVPAAMAFAKETRANAKADPTSVPEDLLGACNELLAKSKSSLWVAREGNNPLSRPSDKAKPAQKVSGSLEKITSWGAKGTAAYQRTLHIKTTRAVVPVPEVLLDADSKKRLATFEGAILDIAIAMQRREEGERLRQREGKVATTPSNRVCARPVTIRGIKLTPDFKFDGEKVARIHLELEYAGESGFQFDESGMQRTLVEALGEKFGRHDEQNRTSNGQEYLWRFPSTVIRCSAGRVTFPDSSFVRKYVAISYEQPTGENTAGKEKL